MYQINNPSTDIPEVVIGIDHGYGNIKTANFCFSSGVITYDREPTFQSNMLVYGGRYYIIGEDHKEFIAEKMTDNDFYVLTLAAVAQELCLKRIETAKVHLAAGLPLTWVSEQKDEFKAYLLQNETVDFTYRGLDYHVTFTGADVFPQGFAAVVDDLISFKGVNMLCDIGNGTMNVMYINNSRPIQQKCFTEKYGTQQCMIAIRESLLRQFGAAVDESMIEQVVREGMADISERYLNAIQAVAKEYAAGIFRLLREHGYDPELMRLYIVGGGGYILRHFGEYDHDRVTIISDICATAKGYELLSRRKLVKGGAV